MSSQSLPTPADPLTTSQPDNAPSALASRLIPASVFNTSASRAALSDALVAAAQRHTITLLFSVAPHFFKGGDGLTSVSPAWRESLWHVRLSQNPLYPRRLKLSCGR